MELTTDDFICAWLCISELLCLGNAHTGILNEINLRKKMRLLKVKP